MDQQIDIPESGEKIDPVALWRRAYDVVAKLIDCTPLDASLAISRVRAVNDMFGVLLSQMLIEKRAVRELFHGDSDTPFVVE